MALCIVGLLAGAACMPMAQNRLIKQRQICPIALALILASTVSTWAAQLLRPAGFALRQSFPTHTTGALKPIAQEEAARLSPHLGIGFTKQLNVARIDLPETINGNSTSAA